MPSHASLVRATPEGLYCAAGDFYVDPRRPVQRAVITHAHADHARRGSDSYLASETCLPLLRARLGADVPAEALAWGETVRLGDTRVSLHPAGHILGSSQVRIEHGGETWVVTGDFKRAPDPTCEPFEVVACDTLVTEATFALPVYRWPEPGQVAAAIFRWWEASRAEARPSVLFCYALGKAQRVLAELARFTDRPVYAHGAVMPLVELYREAGVAMLPVHPVDLKRRRGDWGGELVIAPPSAAGSPWMRRFAGASTGFCSGWMRVRGARRRRGYDRGFVLSDHADWPALVATVVDTGASRVLTTHGQDSALVRYLNESLDVEAESLGAPFPGAEGAAS
ncbi:MAG: ligase-associated DNA damage response exonuclease [Gammaproteobacteria bacterium]